MRKKLVPIILVCCMLAALFAVSVTAASNIVAQGDCGADGSNVHWSLDNSGHLSITGSGAIRDYWRDFYWESDNWWGTYSNAPWYVMGSDEPQNGNLITSLTVSDGITCIGTNAFLGLKNLAEVTLPDSVIQIKDGAFARCTSLTQITLPESVASIEANVFRICTGLRGFPVSDKIVSIGECAFYGCQRLKNIVMPASVKYISAQAFRECNQLQGVTILGKIPILTGSTFQDCPALEEITIPDSVVVIGSNAFSGCSSLKDVYFTGTESLWNEISVGSGNTPLANATLHTDTSPGAAYRINGITVSGGTEGLGAIPYGSFFATVSITNRASGTSPMICLAAYTENGKFQKFVYVTVKEPVGGTVEVTLPVDNSYMDIAELKAFAVSSFDFTPVGNVVAYPES